MSSILAAGLNLMDVYIDQGLMYPGGNELNVAIYAKRLGHRGAFMGVFGTDETVPLIKGVLDRENVDYRCSRNCEGENGLSWVRLVNGDRVFVGHNDGGVTGKYRLHFTPADTEYIRTFDVVSTSLYGRIKEQELVTLCKIGVPVSYDFAEKLPGDVFESILPFLAYAFFSCSHRSMAEIYDLLKSICARGCRYAIATRGAQGAILYDGQDFYSQEAVPTNVVDTMGAGDSFITAFLTSHRAFLLEGAQEASAIRRSLRTGAEFAAQTCAKPGAIGYAFQVPEKGDLCGRCFERSGFVKV